MEVQRSQPQGHGSKEGEPGLSCVLEEYLSSWGLLLPQAASVSKGSAHSVPLCRQNPDEQIVRIEGFSPRGPCEGFLLSSKSRPRGLRGSSSQAWWPVSAQRQNNQELKPRL